MIYQSSVSPTRAQVLSFLQIYKRAAEMNPWAWNKYFQFPRSKSMFFVFEIRYFVNWSLKDIPVLFFEVKHIRKSTVETTEVGRTPNVETRHYKPALDAIYPLQHVDQFRVTCVSCTEAQWGSNHCDGVALSPIFSFLQKYRKMGKKCTYHKIVFATEFIFCSNQKSRKLITVQNKNDYI